MCAKPVILAVDIGTSATKAVLFDEDARQVSMARRHYAVLTPQAGWSEQAPEDVASAVLSAMEHAIADVGTGVRSVVGAGLSAGQSAGLSTGPSSGLAAGSSSGLGAEYALVGIVFSSQLYSVLACTPDGIPLSASLTWSDTRSARIATEIRGQAAAQGIRERTGCPIDAIYPLAKVNWLRQHVDLPASTRMVSIKEFVLHRLTGQWIADWSVASATGLFDIREKKWDSEALAAAGIRTENLSTLVSPRFHDVRLRADVADRLGIPRETPVVLGGGDGPLASIGVGSLQTDSLAVNVGSSAAARLLISSPFVDPSGHLWTYVADEGLWVVGGIVSNGGIALEWALRAFFGGYYDAEANGVAAHVLAERMAAAIPPGAEKLLFVPYLGGEQCPAWNPATRGAFVGMDYRHTPGHFMRAVLEGITRSIYLVSENITAACAAQSGPIRTTGGVSTSPLWLQIAADMFGKRIAVPETAEGSARGAAVIGLLALGLRKSISDFTLLAAAQQVVEPNPAAHEFYMRQQERFMEALASARGLDSGAT